MLFRASPALALLTLVALTGASNDSVPSYPGGILPESVRSFVIYGDTQHTLGVEFWRAQHDVERNLVAEAISGERPDFIVNCGDVVSVGADAAEWTRFYRDNRAIWNKRIPYFPALGNHDYYGDNEKALGNFFRFFPYLEGKSWYPVRAGSALILVLNSNFDEMTPEEIRTQDEWLESALSSAESDAGIRHVLLCFHHPPYTNAVLLGDSKEVQKHFLSRRTPKVKVVVSGHVHSYERFQKDGLHYVVSGGAGGPTASLQRNSPRHEDRYRGGAERGFHYLRFRLDGDLLRCDVMMLGEDRAFHTVDEFSCP